MGIWKILTKQFLMNSIMLMPTFSVAGEIDEDRKNSVATYNNNALSKND